jgi:hypothetical protein
MVDSKSYSKMFTLSTTSQKKSKTTSDKQQVIPKPIIVAVGIDVVLDKELIKSHLSSFFKLGEFEAYDIIDSYKSCFMYGYSCSLGRWTGLVFEQRTMLDWYNKHKDSLVTAYFTRLYKTKHILLLEGTLDGKYFSVVISNLTKGTQTFLHKKNANSGLYGDPIAITRLAITGVPYIHYQ